MSPDLRQIPLFDHSDDVSQSVCLHEDVHNVEASSLKRSRDSHNEARHVEVDSKKKQRRSRSHPLN